MPHSRSISPLGLVSIAPTLHSLLSPSGPISTTVSAAAAAAAPSLLAVVLGGIGPSPSSCIAMFTFMLVDLEDVGDCGAAANSGSSVISLVMDLRVSA